MKKSFLISFIFSFFIFLPGIKAQDLDKSVDYDSTLAQKLGAEKGPNRSQDSTQRAEIQKAHLKNIMHLAKKGKLIIAGPFLDNTDIRGIFIFNVESIKEAEKLTESDPAVKAGVLSMELHLWYGPAILPEALKLNSKLEKKRITE